MTKRPLRVVGRLTQRATLQILCVIASVGAFASVASAQTAGPMRVMPPYRGDVGTAIDDPALMRGEQAGFEAAYKLYKEAAKEYRR